MRPLFYRNTREPGNSSLFCEVNPASFEVLIRRTNEDDAEVPPRFALPQMTGRNYNPQRDLA